MELYGTRARATGLSIHGLYRTPSRSFGPARATRTANWPCAYEAAIDAVRVVPGKAGRLIAEVQVKRLGEGVAKRRTGGEITVTTSVALLPGCMAIPIRVATPRPDIVQSPLVVGDYAASHLVDQVKQIGVA